VLSESEREACTEALVNRTADVATETQCPEHVEIDVLR
jgi:hypothetical protein